MQSELDGLKTEGLLEKQYGFRTGWSTLHAEHFTVKSRQSDDLHKTEVTLKVYTNDVGIVAVVVTVEEQEWKCNTTLETVSR